MSETLGGEEENITVVGEGQGHVGGVLFHQSVGVVSVNVPNGTGDFFVTWTVFVVVVQGLLVGEVDQVFLGEDLTDWGEPSDVQLETTVGQQVVDIAGGDVEAWGLDVQSDSGVGEVGVVELVDNVVVGGGVVLGTSVGGG
ncbi:hypothetical protein WICPIJ_000137 [Wickerhamomyces pijperi]|uniref:Uncharacterized protein n=1 Tax=Wickerhamomyces pijperi TaxID=599730 RepID=A0A9P8QD85_WICPI|nr:hypothetical protein WICPIJ_000137 [Wickerhamomyces pijperi]